ncbi:MAG: translocation/assembly module TamB domain-containing protein, partial [Methylococcaceae bacterium]|nr:translocation/assembly module TamB domain-containing protein [Methylococcaceae bacterium]
LNASLTQWELLSTQVEPQLSNIKGKLSANLGITGSLDQPKIDGNMNLADGGVDLEAVGITVRDIKLQATATGNPDKPIQIAASAKSGQGIIYLNGFADPRGTAELQLKGNDFDVARLPEAQIAVSPDLSLQMTPNQRKISGILKIPKALIELKELPENAVAVSKDEVILGEEKTVPNAAVPVNIDANIEVELGQQIRFSGMGLKTGLTGKLRFNKTGDKMSANGQVEMKQGRYKSYGQDLTVQQGKFIFNGPLDNPLLDVEAIRVSKDQKVTAILNLSGPLTAPSTRLSSKPSLPETDVLAYLVTGGPLNRASKSEGELIAGAALAYGSSRAAWIANKFGLDEFEVKEGNTLQDTLLTAGHYLTPDFYIGTRLGLFNNQAALVMKRKLTEKWNLESQAGTSQRLKLNYEFDTD